MTLGEKALGKNKLNLAFQIYFSLGETEKCYEILQKSDLAQKNSVKCESAIFSRAFLPSKLEESTNSWKQQLSNKPYEPVPYSQRPDQKAVVDLSQKVESYLNTYEQKERESASDYEAAINRHFTEIALEIDGEEAVSLKRPLSEFESKEHE